ncbi:uncharacterized protein LOC105222599 [Bactrocera dorsalis]|uniref:Uncharacterized protein LOC105222599 n=1 Tax=Bactrocera dorsalis TaxID=27457 RepID=A0ABM3JE25_BACDO|nr:uncharacterized protein LOC105222599 [Bactrocera dorsalis]
MRSQCEYPSSELAYRPSGYFSIWRTLRRAPQEEEEVIEHNQRCGVIYLHFVLTWVSKAVRIMLSINTACLLAALLALAYVWCRYTYGYWKRNKIPYMTPFPLIGNMQVLFTMSNSFYLYLTDIYKDARMSKAAAVGIYILNRPALVLREPELIKSVLVKEFLKFANRSAGCDPHNDPLGSNNLFFVNNPQWKDLRTKITPVFTTGKIKQMYPLMTEIGMELEDHLKSYAKNGDAFVTEIKEVCALFTTDMIATIAFGVKANSLVNPNGEFRTQGRKLLTFTLSRAKDFFVAFFVPKWVTTLRVKIFTTEFSSFLRDTIEHVMALREQSKATRNDLIDVLVSLKEEAVAKGEYNAQLQDMLTAQAAVFLSAGFEGPSSTMTFTLYELSKRPDLQERLRNEICEAFVAEQGKMSYETINNLPYLSMVMDEVLRLYPVLPYLDREHLPKEGEKQFDLKPFYDYTMPVGMPVYIPIFGIQRDPEFWPNPNTFDPERFNAENKKTHKPMSYLPFGTGPRNCIGGRIGLLQSKVGLVHILKNHYVTTCEKTPSEITFDPLSIFLHYKGGIYLKFINDKRYERNINYNAKECLHSDGCEMRSHCEDPSSELDYRPRPPHKSAKQLIINIFLYSSYHLRSSKAVRIMLSVNTACLLAALLGLVYVWCRYTYGYWKRNKIPYMTPLPLIGNMEVLFKMSNSFYLYLSDVYKDAKMSKAAAVGIYILNKPALVLREPELIKSVLIKEFSKFANRSATCDPHNDALGWNNLFFIRNPQWKDLRSKITPVFTTGKIKQMYPLMTEIGTELEAHLNSYAKTNDAFVTEVKEVCASFTTDMIATIAFGVKANSLVNPNGEFRTQGRKLFTFTLRRAIDFFIAFFVPKWVSTFRIKLFTTEFSSFLRGTIEHVMTSREESKATRNDLIDVLVSLKQEAVAKGEYNPQLQDMLTAQAAVFLSAGFETSSSTMTFALYELSKRPDLQERLRNEICEALVAERGKMSYETINNLPYLSMVVDEVLRLYPVLPYLDREYQPKEGEKQFDLKPFYDYKVPVGMPVFVPIFGIQRDPEFWPNPDTFDPERFNAENKKTHKPMSYLPFGNGPRNCIGSRIGLLQSKTGLVHILKNHYVTTCEKTPSEITFDPLSIVLSYKDGIYLNFVNDKRYERNARQSGP